MDADVLVVGASPAGLAAAREAAAAGARVILLERKRSWREHHPANTFFKSMWRRTGLPLPDECVTHRLRGMELVSPGGHVLTLDMAGYAVDRVALDRWLAELVEDAGGKVRLGREVTGLARDGHGAVLGVDTPRGPVRAAVTVLACGVGSPLVDATGLRPTRHPEDVAWAREAVCTAPGAGDAPRFRYYVGSCAPGWKATLSPLGGDRIGIGVYVRRHGPDMGEFFQAHLRRVTCELGRVPRVLQVWDAGDPIATLPRELVADGLALAGGCAGQSGIAFGIAAGAICGRVAAGATAYDDVRAVRLSDYPKAWRCALGADYRRGRFALEAVRRMRDAELDRVAQVFEGRDLTPMLGRSTAGLAARVLGACLRRDPGALGGLRALARR